MIRERYIRRVFDTMERADWHIYQVLTKRSSLMRRFVRDRYRGGEAPPHIWLGVSVEDAAALTRLRHLQQTSASVRFVSFEPLIGPLGEVDLRHIHWVIAGGESGPRARPMQPEWARALRDQCQAQGVAFFFKQWGGRTPKAGGNTLDGRQWLEYPEVDSRRRPGVSLQAAGAPGDGAEDPPDVGPWAREKLECLRGVLDGVGRLDPAPHHDRPSLLATCSAECVAPPRDTALSDASNSSASPSRSSRPASGSSWFPESPQPGSDPVT